MNYFSEILLEERVSDCETMKRENRRVAAMSWNVGDDLPPPKPLRGGQPGNYTIIDHMIMVNGMNTMVIFIAIVI